MPILWTFRRCPYAMRARMAVHVSQIQVEYREIVLRDKPPEMLLQSPKGTVPVCVLSDGTVIDESLDIMRWALTQNDPEQWLPQNDEEKNGIDSWVERVDAFKPWLDRYKYPDRYEEVNREEVLRECEARLRIFETTLRSAQPLIANRTTLADVATFPFIRQFNNVDREQLARWGMTQLSAWLDVFVNGERFKAIMTKRPLFKTQAE